MLWIFTMLPDYLQIQIWNPLKISGFASHLWSHDSINMVTTSYTIQSFHFFSPFNKKNVWNAWKKLTLDIIITTGDYFQEMVKFGQKKDDTISYRNKKIRTPNAIVKIVLFHLILKHENLKKDYRIRSFSIFWEHKHCSNLFFNDHLIDFNSVWLMVYICVTFAPEMIHSKFSRKLLYGKGKPLQNYVQRKL